MFILKISHIFPNTFKCFSGINFQFETFESANLVSSCVIPEKYKKEIESKCFKFIWNGKPDKVKRNTLIGDFEKGGLKMIDIESYFISLIKVKIGIIKALMISTLPNIERFRFDHDKNKLFIFSIFFSQLSFSHFM
jgi:hypothetical protein